MNKGRGQYDDAAPRSNVAGQKLDWNFEERAKRGGEEACREIELNELVIAGFMRR